jgi:hypothetical protein
MRRLMGVLAVAAVLSACGGADWNASHATPTPSTSARSARTAATAAAAVSAGERPYVDAMVASAVASDDTSATTSATTYHCIAAAIVHGFGATVFAANGLTPNGLRNANSTLDALPDPTDEQVTTIGAALQHCKIAKELAIGVGTDLGFTDTATVTCLTKQFDSGPAPRRFLVLAFLERKIDLEAAHAAVGVLAACVDLPTLVLRSANVPIGAETRNCIVNALRGSDAQLKDFFALRMSGTDPETAVQASEQLGVAINRCRPGAHTGFTVPSA